MNKAILFLIDSDYFDSSTGTVDHPVKVFAKEYDWDETVEVYNGDMGLKERRIDEIKKRIDFIYVGMLCCKVLDIKNNAGL